MLTFLHDAVEFSIQPVTVTVPLAALLILAAAWIGMFLFALGSLAKR